MHDVEAAGDVNGDGLDDIALAVHDRTFPHDPAGPASRLRPQLPDFAYIVFGGPARVVHPETLGGNGFTIIDSAGTSLNDQPRVRSAGDVNGDGIADLIVTRINLGRSTTWVVFGKHGAQAAVDLANLGTRGVRLELPADPGLNPLLIAVSGAGDLNNDGIDDLAVAYADHGAPVCGFTDCSKVAVVLGDHQLGDHAINLRALGTAGYEAVLDGAAASGTISDIAPVGDYNGDGVDDLAIGGVRRLKNQATAFSDTVYVLLGSAAPRGTVRLDDLGAAVVAIGREPGSSDPHVRHDRPRRRRLQPGRPRRHPRRRSERRSGRSRRRRPPSASAFVIFGRTGGAPIPDVKRLRPTEGVRIDAPPQMTNFSDQGGFATDAGRARRQRRRRRRRPADRPSRADLVRTRRTLRRRQRSALRRQLPALR